MAVTERWPKKKKKKEPFRGQGSQRFAYNQIDDHGGYEDPRF